MCKAGEWAKRTAVLVGALCNLMQGVSDEDPMKAALVELAASCEASADATVEELKHDHGVSSFKAA